jgi:hypothetical protein
MVGGGKLIEMIKRVWTEQQGQEGFDAYRDIADVVVETDDGSMWASTFVTIPYLQRQMSVSRDITANVANMPPVRFITLETPHVIVENLLPDTIEDTIDNLMMLGIFESVFMPHSESYGIESSARGGG